MTDHPMHAVVTGASRGIGLAIAQGLCSENINVIGTATADVGLESIGRALEPTGHLTAALKLDVSSNESLDDFTAQLNELGLKPLILVNNAGITRDNLLLRMKDDEWNAVINANLGAVYQLSKRLIRNMLKARYGRIVNLTSVVGVAGNAGQANYAAAKAGIIGFTKSLAQEVATRGVTVNAVAPGFINTDMTNALADEQKEAMLARIPMHRIGEASEIAAAVSFLASPAAAYITGETLHVNGGMYMN